MEGKKKYFALVLFLFLGLMIFTFANPAEEEKEFQNSDKDQSETVSDRREETNDEENTNEQEGQQNVLNVVTDNNQVNNQQNVVDNSLRDALAAVEKAEGTYTQEDLDAAKDLVNNVTDTTEKGNLEERLEEVEAGIAVLALLEDLEKQVEEAEEKTHMTDATAYRDDNEISNKIEALNNETVKEALAKRLTTVSKLLDDNAAPVASVEAKAYNDHVEITAEDEAGNPFKLFLSKDNGTEEEITSGEKTTSEGVYTLRLVDDAFNEETITFVVDKSMPKLKDLTNGGHYKDITLNVEDKTKVTIKVTNMDTKEEKEVSDGTKLTADATYMIELTDEAGNVNYYYLAIDSVKPTIEVNGKDLTDKSYLKETTDVVIKDKFLTTVSVTYEKDGNKTTEEYLRADFEVGARNENFKFTYSLDKNGTYTITAKDKFGNTTVRTVTVDTKAPVASYVALLSNGTKDYKYIKNGEQIRVLVAFNEEIKVTDKFVLTVNGKNIKFVRSGDKTKFEYIAQYTIPANEAAMKEGKVEFSISGYQDLAGNTVKDALTTANHYKYNSLTYDRTPAKITLKGKNKVLEPGHYTYDLYAYIEDANSYTATLNDKAYTSGSKISSRTNYVLTVVDAAGNTSSIEFAIDKDKPAIKGVTDGKYYNTSVTPTVTDKNLDKVTLNGKDYVSGTEITEEGTYELIATDKAKNTRKVTFTIDTTLPKIAISAKQNKWTNTHPVTITVTEKNLDKVYYAWTGTYKNTDSDEHRLDFMKNKEAVPADKIVDNGNGTYTITFDTDFQGSNKLVVKVTDLAGNVVTTSSEWVRIDDIAPLYDKLAIRGAAGEWVTKNGKKEYKQYAGTGTVIYVDAHFYEKLETTPVVTLNGKVTLTSPSTAQTTNAQGKTVYVYSYRYELKADDGLEEGPIQVKVTNCKDRAGNSVELTNEDLTMESQSEVIVDRTAPTYSLYKNKLRPVQKPSTVEANGKIYTTDEIELQFHDNYRLKKITLNGNTSTTTAGVTGQVKYITTAGEYVYEAIDAVGNKTTVTIVKVDNELDLLNELDSVTLTKDFTFDGTYTVEAGQTKVLDLGGKTLTLTKSSAKVITNYGKLTIKNGTIKNEQTSTRGIATNYGELIIEDLKIEDASNAGGSTIGSDTGSKLTIKDSEITLTGNTSVAGVYSNGTTEITNTKVTSSQKTAYAVVVNGDAVLENVTAIGYHGGLAVNGGKAHVKSGLYEATGDGYGIWMTNNSSTLVTVDDGTYKSANGYGAYTAMDDERQDAGTVGITINGGNFSGKLGGFKAEFKNSQYDPWDIQIKGGTFKDSDVTEYIDKTQYRQGADWVVKSVSKIDSALYLKEVATKGGIYTLESDLSLSNEIIEIPTGVNLTIDTNGKTISGNYTEAKASSLFKVSNGASLKLTGNGTLTYNAEKTSTSYSTSTIVNLGKLNIDGPTLINNAAKGAPYVIDNGPGAEFTLISGTIKQAGGNRAIRLYSYDNGPAINATLKGGTVTGSMAVYIHLISSTQSKAPEVNLTVDGGTYSSNDTNGFAFYSYSNGNSMENINVTFNGGSFSGYVAFGGGNNKTKKENVTVNVGTFSHGIGRYVDTTEDPSGWIYIVNPPQE